MSQTAIGTFLTLLDRDLVPMLEVQNFFQGKVVKGHIFGAFGFSGSTVDVSGASISATLVFAQSQLLLNMMRQACDGLWLARVRTTWLDPTTLKETGLISEELYAVLAYENDLTRVQVRLGSPLDAISEQIPRRVLSQALVGNLPTSSSVNVR